MKMKVTIIITVLLCLISIIGADQKYKNKYSAESNEPYHKETRDYNKEPKDQYRKDSKNNNKHDSKDQYRKESKDQQKKEAYKTNKYESNRNEAYEYVPETYDPDFRQLQKPFRMAKLNLLWTKAQHRLTEPKLKSLFTELKIHDKEELNWKQSKFDDTDGLKEANLRKKLIGIMSTYGLLEHFEETEDPELLKPHKAFSGPVSDFSDNNSLFKDKKLNRLWEKAEAAGFTPDELNALKEEFHHHQEKVDTYYSILDNIDAGPQDQHENAINEDELDRFNEIGTAEDQAEPNQSNLPNKRTDYLHEANLLREKHRDLRDNFDRLERRARGPNSRDFIEPRVQNLWRVAQHSNFSVDELASLKVELQHYEARLLKLRNLNAEHIMSSEKLKNEKHPDKHDKIQEMHDRLKKQQMKVEKLHEEIENRIFRHSEL